jgi:hypothetical protein
VRQGNNILKILQYRYVYNSEKDLKFRPLTKAKERQKGGVHLTPEI